MKLDEEMQFQKLSLDITPMIDIVFLLVLFFAVGTSFISPENLKELRVNLARMIEDKIQLAGDLAHLEKDYEERIAFKQNEITDLNEKLDLAGDRLSKLEWQRSALEQETDGLKKNLGAITEKNADLAEQLERAFNDYRQLNIELKVEHERGLEQAAKQTLLQQKLAEKTEGLADLQQRLEAAGTRQEKLSSELNALTKERDEQATNSEQMSMTILRLESEIAKYRKIADLDKAQVEEVLRAQENMRKGLTNYLEAKQINIQRDRQRLTLQLSDKILFDSGSASIKPGGVEILLTIGDILKSRIGELDVQIGGHTDNVPISAHSGPYHSNWELSAARAVNVVRLFQSELTLDPKRLSAVGYGEYRPIASNATEEGRALNRRIEIVLLPR